MLPPERSTRASLAQLAAKEEGSTSDDTSNRSTTPTKARRSVKSASSKQSEDKKARRKLTAAQKQALEELALREVNPSLEERRALSMQIGLELKAVSVWFQNKRRPTTVNRVPIATIYTPAGKEEADVDGSSGRVVFGNVSNNLSPSVPQSPRLDSDFTPEPEDISSRGRFDTPNIWKYLPSSSPTLSHTSSVSRFDDAQDSDATPTSPTPCAQSKRDGRKSLEWACKNDASMRGKLMKRRIQTFLKEANDKMSIGSPTRKRQRTDVRPSQPSPRLRKRERRKSDNFKRLTIAATAMEMHVERDVYDVAVALMELKGRHGLRPVRGRKSI